MSHRIRRPRRTMNSSRSPRKSRFLAFDRLEPRCVLATTIPTVELTEGNAADWSTFASDQATATVTDDITHVRQGNHSLKFTTLSGFDTGMRLEAPVEHWDITSVNLLEFSLYGDNPNAFGWQGNQPIVKLLSTSGSIQLQPDSQRTPNQSWAVVHVPLQGGAGWTRTETGTFDPTNVTALEIHQDTWDYGFTIYYDGLRFAQRGADDLPPAGPAPPPGVDPDAVSPRALLYIFDPILENLGGIRTHTAYGWEDPQQLTDRIVEAFEANSHGLVQYQVVDTIIADVHPYYKDGAQHTDESFVADWAERDFSLQQAGFDYVRFINENNLVSRVESGEIDEVWVYTSPFGGTWESTMAGQGAYWINGPTQDVPSERVFPIMGWNYERGLAEALHSFGHRAESTLDHIYGPQGNHLDHNWAKFAFLDRYQPGAGLGGVGNIHFPVNGASDYDYANTAFVVSNADDWLNYPNFTGATRSINRTEWQRPDGDWQLGYMNWWYEHLPHVSGRGPDYHLNNWWRYITDLEQFKATSGNLAYTRGIPEVQIDSVEFDVDSAQVGVNAWVDGALGRVDLYVDGVYHSTDTLAPFRFSIDLTTFSAGDHTLIAKAYELQNGTEGVSAPASLDTGEVSLQRAFVSGADAGGGPHVRVFDANGQELMSFFAFDPGFSGGVRVATGDVDNDGVLDIIAAAGPGGGPHVRVFSGLTGAPLPGPQGSFFAYGAGFTGGVFVAAGDVNRDGHADIITAAGAGGGPHVRVFSGADGSELHSFFAYGASFSGGVSVAAADIDGDAYVDIITGAGPGGGPHVRIFSGATGEAISAGAGSFFAYGADFAGGVYVAAGDVDGDGQPDIITGAGAGGGPHVRAFDGQSGGELRSFFAYDQNFTGGVRVGSTDLNGDLSDDIITAAGPGGGPHVRAFSGANQAELASFFPYAGTFAGGVFVAGLPFRLYALALTQSASASGAERDAPAELNASFAELHSLEVRPAVALADSPSFVGAENDSDAFGTGGLNGNQDSGLLGIQLLLFDPMPLLVESLPAERLIDELFAEW